VIAPFALMESFAFSRWKPPVAEPLTGVRSPPPLATFSAVASRLTVFAAMPRSSMRHSQIVDQQIAASLREVEAPPSNIACGKC
jgi:hypothetical protein